MRTVVKYPNRSRIIGRCCGRTVIGAVVFEGVKWVVEVRVQTKYAQTMLWRRNYGAELTGRKHGAESLRCFYIRCVNGCYGN